MSDIIAFLGAGMWFIGFLGIIIFAIFAFINRKRGSFSLLLGAGVISFVILVIGIALMTFTEENYWERQEMSESEEKENEEIVKNIQKNYQKEEEAYQNSIKEHEKAMESYQEESTESEKAVENTYQNIPEIDFLEEQGVYNAVVNYGNNMIEAINKGDFRIVEPFLLPNSNLYISQEKLVNDLYSKGIVEHVYTFNIESVKKLEENIFEAETFEEISIESGGKEQVKEFQWLYTIQNVNGQFLLSDIKTNN